MDEICAIIQKKYEMDREVAARRWEVKRLEEMLPQKIYQVREAKAALLEYESGFRKLLDKFKGTFPEKQEALSAALRQAEAEEAAHRRELDAAKQTLAELEQTAGEMPTREQLYQQYPELAYLKRCDTLDCTERLIRLLRENETYLIEARDWAENRNAEFRGHAYGTAYDKDVALNKASDCARQIWLLLEQIRENGFAIESPAYFRSPDGFIAGAARQYGQLDRINYAIRTVRDAQSMLQELQAQLAE